VFIGVFDSGLGGLSIARAISRRLPEYDLMYLGDTKRVPYGGRSQEAIHGFAAEALNYLFENDCHLVVLACNTASAEALRRSQQEYLPRHYPDRRVLGVVIPTAEAVAATGARRVGVLATRSTAASGAYEREIKRQAPNAEVRVLPAPLLVPLVENDGLKYVDPVLDDYLAELRLPSSFSRGAEATNVQPVDREENEEGPGVEQAALPQVARLREEKGEGIDCLVLGCTHYDLLKDRIRAKTNIPVIAQDEVVPEKLADYLNRHPEHDERLGRNGERIYRVTDLGPGYQALARTFAGEDLHLEKVDL
jgi:glutamate racemase